jgi:hypothetical protein
MNPETIQFGANPVTPPQTIPFGSKPIQPTQPQGQSLSASIFSKLASSAGKKMNQQYTSALEKGKSSILGGGAKVQQGLGKLNFQDPSAGVADIATGFGEAALGTGAATIQALFAPFTTFFQEVGEKTGLKPIEGIKESVSKGGGVIGQFLQSEQGQKLKDYFEANPQVATNIMDALTVGTSLLGSKALNAKIPNVGTVAKGLADDTANLVKGLTTKSEAAIEAKITGSFEKGIKPSTAGKNTMKKVKNYKEDVVEAVKAIKENKDNLSFIDESGNPIKGQTPKTLQELTDALDQTKKSVFGKYDALAKQAGKGGVKVNTEAIAGQLDDVINNKALSLTNPRAIEYARSLKERLLGVKELDATTAQEVIQNYNKSLEAFYRNPSYDNASHAAIDSMVANRLRESLDSGITGLTGKEYQALKSTYGALKTIEKDVVRATIRQAKGNVKGLIDFTDIFSGGQVVNGILNLNPGQIASGLTQKAIAQFYKYLNNPNRAIESMFQAANKLPTGKVMTSQMAADIAEVKANGITSLSDYKKFLDGNKK